tara:strand:+ start:471 stop:608 length:138 start_codon:yes stop_codon:yes gene_type:complete
MDKKEIKYFTRAVAILSILIVLSIVLTSCGTQKGGCGGSPMHLGN